MTQKRYTQKEDDWEILDNGKHLAYAHSARQAEIIIDELNNKEDKIKQLEERINNQVKLLEEQQEQIDNYIDIKSKLNSKITEYQTKSEEYELCACGCGSKQNYIKKLALEEFKEEIFKKDVKE